MSDSTTSDSKPAGAKAAKGAAATAAVTATVTDTPPLPPRSIPRMVLGFFGSMKLAVWLLITLALLTWLGTLAQVDTSTFEVQRQYFESWFLIAKLPLSFWGWAVPGGSDGQGFVLRIPLPGAYPVMALLFVNLLVGGMLRLRWSLRNIGILITHVGIAFLLVAGFVKLEASYSGMLGLYETPADGKNEMPGRIYESSHFVSSHDYELALLTDHGDTIEERVVPENVLWAARDQGSVTLRAPGMPFSLHVHHWIDHSQVLPKGPMVSAPTPVVDGMFLQSMGWPPGVQPQAEQEIAGCYVSVFGDGGERFETILWGLPRWPDDESNYVYSFSINGQRYGLDLRHVVFDLPFSVRLDKFEKRDHPGTMSPKDFRSYVTVKEGGQTLESQIFMNNPLRKAGYVLYQTNWGPQPMGGPPWYSVLEVANNPSDMWPKVACWIIAAGLVIHFGAKLRRFLNSSARTTLSSPSA